MSKNHHQKETKKLKNEYFFSFNIEKMDKNLKKKLLLNKSVCKYRVYNFCWSTSPVKLKSSAWRRDYGYSADFTTIHLLLNHKNSFTVNIDQ